MEVEIVLLVGSLGIAYGTFTLKAFRWEHRFRGENIVSQHFTYRKVLEGLAAMFAC